MLPSVEAQAGLEWRLHQCAEQGPAGCQQEGRNTSQSVLPRPNVGAGTCTWEPGLSEGLHFYMVHLQGHLSGYSPEDPFPMVDHLGRRKCGGQKAVCRAVGLLQGGLGTHPLWPGVGGPEMSPSTAWAWLGAAQCINTGRNWLILYCEMCQAKLLRPGWAGTHLSHVLMLADISAVLGTGCSVVPWCTATTSLRSPRVLPMWTESPE